jgi:hypothetical protein
MKLRLIVENGEVDRDIRDAILCRVIQITGEVCQKTIDRRVDNRVREILEEMGIIPEEDESV